MSTGRIAKSFPGTGTCFYIRIIELTLDRRIQRLVTSEEPSQNRYCISQPPTPTHWGRIAGVTREQKLSHGGRPIRFWIVGQVARGGCEIVTREGLSPSHVWIGVIPVRAGEYDCWKRYMTILGGIQGKSPRHPLHTVNNVFDKVPLHPEALLAERNMTYASRGRYRVRNVDSDGRMVS